ncbi:MAG: release factor glutamine methyltransferase [Alcanivorax sp.]|jgi:release factor glutamine methyltransferase
MTSVKDLLREAHDLPGESPRRDAEILLCHILDKPRSWLYTWPESEPTDPELERYTSLLQQRQEGQPIAYLTGSREFWSLNLAVNEHTLIPRPETEGLVEWALQLPLSNNASVLDLGTGSGAVALALASERSGWSITAVDVSEPALVVAEANRRALGLDNVCCRHSDWFGALQGLRFDLLVSNPPYVDAGDAHMSEGDVRFEPAGALLSGADGLDDIRQLIKAAPAHMTPGAGLLLEHGYQQGREVREILSAAGYSGVVTRRDVQGHERVTGGFYCAD